MIDNKNSHQSPSPIVSAIPLVVLIAMISLVISLFGADALAGGSQIALLFATSICVALSMAIYKMPWKGFEESVEKTIGNASVSIVILLIIGMLSGAWMVSGVVPTLIYYGIKIMSPELFLVSTCIICALVSVITGSSWTTVATIGVALIGISEALSIPAGWTAGAIISGSYFGDKISPLSDTTVLASSAAKTPLFTHIRYMFYTTIPSITIATIVFLIAGFIINAGGEATNETYSAGLLGTYNISLWTLLVPAITAIMIAKRVPSLITLFVSAILGGVCALVTQPHILASIAGTESTDTISLVKGMMTAFFTSTSVNTGNEQLNSLVSTSGMAGMLNTIWLILCAMTFGGCMVASGMLQSLMGVLLRRVHGTTSLVASTAATGLTMNAVTGDQYMSIIMTANMYSGAYEENGLENRLLSRTTEDSVTVTSVLIPWNTCGMTQATVLGVPTLTFLPYCVFNYISPLMSILVASLGWKVYRKKKANSMDEFKENE